jgi:predicted chitinase
MFEFFVVAALVLLLFWSGFSFVWLAKILDKMERIMSTGTTALAALQAQVAQNTTIEASAVTLIQGLAAQIAAAGTDSAALAALTTNLNASATALAAAITANTPAAPPAA